MPAPKSALIALLGKDPSAEEGDDEGDAPSADDHKKAKVDAARVILEAIRADNADKLVDALETFCDLHGEASPDDEGESEDTAA